MCTGGDPGGGSKDPTPVAASRTAAPTGEEMRAKRAPGQRDVKLPSDRVGRPKEPGGVDDRPAPKKTAPQAAFDSIQELRGRLDKQPPGTLGAIGRFSLERQIKALQEGATPVMADGLTVGTVTKEGSYTGRPEFGDFARSEYKKGGATLDTTLKAQLDKQRVEQERDAPPPPAPKADPVVEVAQMGGSGTLTTKRRRGSGRRTAFGTRQSLVNLRNV